MPKVLASYKNRKKMLNFQSVTNSEPQIRSSPALRMVGNSTVFQKRISSLLEHSAVPFPTYQIAKEASKSFLSGQKVYAWVRPAHLRAKWLILEETMPLLLVDQRDVSKRMSSLRIPFDKRKVQHSGPIVCEAAWDAQDHILWIWDVIVWQKQTVWNTMSYSQRWSIIKEIAGSILQRGGADAEVRVPTWKCAADMSRVETLDPATSVEFQPERAGQRRHLYLVKDDSVKTVAQTHAERKMVAEGGPKQTLVCHRCKGAHWTRDCPQRGGGRKMSESSDVPVAPAIHVPSPVAKHENIIIPHLPPLPASPPVEAIDTTVVVPLVALPPAQQTPDRNIHVAVLRRDTVSKLPDTYRLTLILDNTDAGLAAIRSLELSMKIRDLLKTRAEIKVDVQWYEPFHKYEVKKIHS
jgi:hypothetical protein